MRPQQRTEVNTEPLGQGISNIVDFAIAQSLFSSTYSIKGFPSIFDHECQHVNGETYFRFVREVEVVLVRLNLVESVLALFRIIQSYPATNFPDNIGPRLRHL